MPTPPPATLGLELAWRKLMRVLGIDHPYTASKSQAMLRQLSARQRRR